MSELEGQLSRLEVERTKSDDEGRERETARARVDDEVAAQLSDLRAKLAEKESEALSLGNEVARLKAVTSS